MALAASISTALSNNSKTGQPTNNYQGSIGVAMACQAYNSSIGYGHSNPYSVGGSVLVSFWERRGLLPSTIFAIEACMDGIREDNMEVNSILQANILPNMIHMSETSNPALPNQKFDSAASQIVDVFSSILAFNKIIVDLQFPQQINNGPLPPIFPSNTTLPERPTLTNGKRGKQPVITTSNYESINKKSRRAKEKDEDDDFDRTPEKSRSRSRSRDRKDDKASKKGRTKKEDKKKSSDKNDKKKRKRKSESEIDRPAKKHKKNDSTKDEDDEGVLAKVNNKKHVDPRLYQMLCGFYVGVKPSVGVASHYRSCIVCSYFKRCITRAILFDIETRDQVYILPTGELVGSFNGSSSNNKAESPKHGSGADSDGSTDTNDYSGGSGSDKDEPIPNGDKYYEIASEKVRARQVKDEENRQDAKKRKSKKKAPIKRTKRSSQMVQCSMCGTRHGDGPSCSQLKTVIHKAFLAVIDGIEKHGLFYFLFQFPHLVDPIEDALPDNATISFLCDRDNSVQGSDDDQKHLIIHFRKQHSGPEPFFFVDPKCGCDHIRVVNGTARTCGQNDLGDSELRLVFGVLVLNQLDTLVAREFASKQGPKAVPRSYSLANTFLRKGKDGMTHLGKILTAITKHPNWDKGNPANKTATRGSRKKKVVSQAVATTTTTLTPTTVKTKKVYPIVDDADEDEDSESEDNNEKGEESSKKPPPVIPAPKANKPVPKKKQPTVSTNTKEDDKDGEGEEDEDEEDEEEEEEADEDEDEISKDGKSEDSEGEDLFNEEDRSRNDEDDEESEDDTALASGESFETKPKPKWEKPLKDRVTRKASKEKEPAAKKKKKSIDNKTKKTAKSEPQPKSDAVKDVATAKDDKESPPTGPPPQIKEPTRGAKTTSTSTQSTKPATPDPTAKPLGSGDQLNTVSDLIGFEHITADAFVSCQRGIYHTFGLKVTVKDLYDSDMIWAFNSLIEQQEFLKPEIHSGDSLASILMIGDKKKLSAITVKITAHLLKDDEVSAVFNAAWIALCEECYSAMCYYASRRLSLTNMITNDKKHVPVSTYVKYGKHLSQFPIMSNKMESVLRTICKNIEEMNSEDACEITLFIFQIWASGWFFAPFAKAVASFITVDVKQKVNGSVASTGKSNGSVASPSPVTTTTTTTTTTVPNPLPATKPETTVATSTTPTTNSGLMRVGSSPPMALPKNAQLPSSKHTEPTSMTVKEQLMMAGSQDVSGDGEAMEQDEPEDDLVMSKQTRR